MNDAAATMTAATTTSRITTPTRKDFWTKTMERVRGGKRTRAWLYEAVLPATWKVAFAIVALADIATCWPSLLNGWFDQPYYGNERVVQPLSSSASQCYNDSLQPQDGQASKGGESTCRPAYYPFFVTMVLSPALSFVYRYVGIVFCWCCLVEAALSAREAKRIAFENAALDSFERKLARLYSSTRFSVFRQQPTSQDYKESEQDLHLARNTLRVWSPVASILLAWFVLLPWADLVYTQLIKRQFWNAVAHIRIASNGDDDANNVTVEDIDVILLGGYAECRKDTALATIWITQFVQHGYYTFKLVQTRIVDWAWSVALPYRFRKQPKRFVQRIQLLLKWIRYLRFAGPLLRLGLKLQDQFWVFTRTWRQTFVARTEKAKRLAQRSKLFEDIRRIESLAKVQTKLASVPSQLFTLVQEGYSATGLDRILNQKKEEGLRLKQKLAALKRTVQSRRTSMYTSADLYDRAVDLMQEVTNSASKAVWNSNLISPHTRFSVGWRCVVTFALLAELTRLYASWKLSDTFKVSYTQMISSLLVECNVEMMDRFRKQTRQAKPIRQWIGKLLKLPNVELATCMPSNPTSRLFLRMGDAFESFVDIVCFLDIFVWFSTGELNDQGLVVPKPFVSRCIIPGTLVQILDHPTLPDKLPLLLAKFFAAAGSVGYSRAIRWMLAIFPAAELIARPFFKHYLFRHMEEEEFLQYTQSFALDPSFCGVPYGSTANFKRQSFRTTTMSTSRMTSSDSSSHDVGLLSPLTPFSPTKPGGRRLSDILDFDGHSSVLDLDTMFEDTSLSHANNTFFGRSPGGPPEEPRSSMMKRFGATSSRHQLVGFEDDHQHGEMPASSSRGDVGTSGSTLSSMNQQEEYDNDTGESPEF